MRTTGILLAVIWAGVGTALAQEELQPLPVPLTNNAVTAVKVQGQTLVYSFNGTFSRNGDAATLTPGSNVNPIPVGASRYFGIVENRPADSPLPSNFTLNGAVTGPVSCVATQI